MTPDQLRPGDVVMWLGVARVVHRVDLLPGGGFGPDQWLVEWDHKGRGRGAVVMGEGDHLDVQRTTPETDQVEAHPGQVDALEALGVEP